MKKDLEGLAAEFRDYLERETNSPLTIPTRDHHIRKIAAEINTGLRKLRKQRNKYMSGDRELKEAVTNISHDLRTPITAIYGYLDLLEYEEDVETVKFYIRQIQNRTDCLRQLTEELFRYSVIVSSWQGAYEDAMLNRILEESLLACYGEFAQKGIEPVIAITDVPVHCRIDRPAFDRIISNILSNVLKYSDGDLQVGLDADGTIWFTNSAKNLTPVMVERLFDRFYTVETGRNSTGLGLSIARALTERIGGKIKAVYTDGKLTISLRFQGENQ
ncbi:sensor histidine kinase [Eisenbergiella tayi]|uniref:sensor histidine kinase n=1 Tax=Eisenbergiella tayi TaxID=1432052 RepID=UPI0024322ECE|nr:HAMP domain-containing sensor histidine kinase [Eisenbergiella tayi]